MQIVVNIEKKHLAFLVLFVAIIGLTGFSVAYDGTGEGDPTYMGHSIDEIFPGAYYTYQDGEGGTRFLMITRPADVGDTATIFDIVDNAWYNGDQILSRHSFSVKGNTKFQGRVSVTGNVSLDYGDQTKLDLCEGANCYGDVPVVSGDALCIAADGIVGRCLGK